MPDTVTLTTIKTGPAQTTAKIFSGPQSLQLDFLANTFTVVDSGGVPFIGSLTGVTTITDTITSGVHAVLVSGA